MKKIKYILFFLLLLIFTACGGKKEEKLETVDVVLDWYPNAIHCFLYNAIEKGYFGTRGIKSKSSFSFKCF